MTEELKNESHFAVPEEGDEEWLSTPPELRSLSEPSEPKPSAFYELVSKFVTRLGDVREWTFDGEIIDLGTPSGKCTCDHPIRYVFMISHPDGRTAPVGSECIKHFQAYNPDLFAKMSAANENFWKRIREAEKARKENENQIEAEAAKVLYEEAREEANKLLTGRAGWLPGELYTLRVKLNTKLPEYKRTKSYIDFYKRERKAIYSLIVKYLNKEAETPAHLRSA